MEHVMTTKEQSLEGLVERVKGWFGQQSKPQLRWSIQHPSWKRPPGEGLLHFAFSDIGTFEIYEDPTGNSFLLHFPKRLRKPAELFHDIGSAKTHALTALQSSETRK